MSALWDRIAAAFPDARADRRDGLRLDWDDRWVHVRASNTEPIVRVIAEAADPAEARELGRPHRPGGSANDAGARSMITSNLAHLREAALGRLRRRRRHALAQTTTFLFARSSIAQGWIRRSFFLRALHHGLAAQVRPARLRAADRDRPELHFPNSRSSSWSGSPMRISWSLSGRGSMRVSSIISTQLRQVGHADRARVLLAASGHRTPGHLPWLQRTS